jgi:L-lactate dehydrogenase complex protein LldG
MSGAKSSAREAMLGRIRDRVSGATSTAQRTAAVATRLGLEASHLVPERAQKDAAGLAALFKAHLKGQSASVVEVASYDAIPTAIADWLRATNLPMRLRCGDDERLGAMPWTREPALTVEKGRATASDEVGLTHAAVGVAETGTLVLASGAKNPVTLNFLPENHVVVVRARDIVGPYETAFERVRAILGKGVMPRTLNMISGPSRTGDIGGRLVMGAHGPRRMCVVIVND